MTTSTTARQVRPFQAYLAAQPRWEDKPKWFPGMGQHKLPPRRTAADQDLWKSRDRS